uniref:BTB domain-containing protein n=1 Tax=Anopheles epiroticus TaxID=199890 RepID=A0A182P7P4_9DIPT
MLDRPHPTGARDRANRNPAETRSRNAHQQQQQHVPSEVGRPKYLALVGIVSAQSVTPADKIEPDGAAGGMSGNQKTLIRGPHPSEYVKLNVGGCLYYTTIGTLCKQDTMLRAMFSGRLEVLTDSEGWILIDRCGTHFGTILNFLRDGSVALPETTKGIAELLAESKYYCIEELIEACEKVLAKKEPICRVPLITSQKEEQYLISTATKPVVKLLINRHNNKYSYTNTSDDNLLKNIELFDKLSLRFSGRVFFIKDVIGSSEICCWSFYGNGKKVAEVCCTSIVYATDKKHTKVEFPEARIFEETLNILLYENKNAPDQELMQATSLRGAVGGISSYTSDEEEERTGLARLRSNKQNNPT